MSQSNAGSHRVHSFIENAMVGTASVVPLAFHPTGTVPMWKVPQPASQRGRQWFRRAAGHSHGRFSLNLLVCSSALDKKRSWSWINSSAKSARNGWSGSGLFTSTISSAITVGQKKVGGSEKSISYVITSRRESAAEWTDEPWPSNSQLALPVH